MRAIRLALVGVLVLTGCVSPQRIARSAAKLELGVAYYREGNVEGSIAELREATKLDPRAWRPWNTLGVVYIAKDQRELAEDAFRQALRIAPEEGEILNNYGTLLVDLGRNDEAVVFFEKALADLDYRNTAMVQSNLSFALLRAGRSDDALRHAREATRRAPNLCRGWYNLGLIQEQRMDALSALDAYAEAREQCPDDSTAATLRTGCIQVETGLVDEGVPLLEGVAKRAPNTPYADQARACLRLAER